MGKNTEMIPINSEALKSYIKKRGTIMSLEEKLGVSRQAINGWFASKRIPPKQLSIVSSSLDFSKDELKHILEREDLRPNVLFRTKRNVVVPEKVKQEVTAVATDFFSLVELATISKSDAKVKIETDDPKTMAQRILRELQLSSQGLALDQIILALEALDIHVLFHDLGKEFRDADAQAACASRGDKCIIFVDIGEKLEDVAWRIFHEACHIFAGHQSCNQEQEKFCNAVATEILTPHSFFIENKIAIKRAFEGPIVKAPFIVKDIARTLGSASFMGVLLALRTHRLINPKVAGYLFKKNQKLNETSLKVRDIIIPKPEQDPVKFWETAFRDPDRAKFVKLQDLAKEAMVLGKMSASRAAELFQLDQGSMEELAAKWQSEQSAIA